MAEHRHYFDHEPTDPITCPACAWRGCAAEASAGYHRELMDYSCPRCDRMLLIVGYPTVDEMRAYAAAGNAKAIRELAEFERLRRER